MVFSSSLFLLYFLPAFLLMYFIVPRKAKNYVALLASIFFYAWGGARLYLYCNCQYPNRLLSCKMDVWLLGQQKALADRHQRCPKYRLASLF